MQKSNLVINLVKNSRRLQHVINKGKTENKPRIAPLHSLLLELHSLWMCNYGIGTFGTVFISINWSRRDRILRYIFLPFHWIRFRCCDLEVPRKVHDLSFYNTNVFRNVAIPFDLILFRAVNEDSRDFDLSHLGF